MKKTGIELIAEERKRQIEQEGWTPEHDANHQGGELADAALCYVARGCWRKRCSLDVLIIWPFDDEYWKPTPDDRIRELQKAGALIAAEIDRLQNNG